MVLSSVLLGVLFPRFYGDICFVAGIVFATVAFLVFLVSVVSIGFLPLRVFGVVVSALDSLPAGFCLAWLRTPKRPRGISWHFGPGLGAVKNLSIIYIYHTVLNKEMDPLVQFAGATTQAKRKEMLDFLSLFCFLGLHVPSFRFLWVLIVFHFRFGFSFPFHLTGNHANSKSNYFLGCTIAVWGLNYSNCWYSAGCNAGQAATSGSRILTWRGCHCPCSTTLIHLVHSGAQQLQSITNIKAFSHYSLFTGCSLSNTCKLETVNCLDAWGLKCFSLFFIALRSKCMSMIKLN